MFRFAINHLLGRAEIRVALHRDGVYNTKISRRNAVNMLLYKHRAFHNVLCDYKHL